MSKDIPTNDFSYLWNDLPRSERERLMPTQIESQILHIWQCKQIAVRLHRKHMKELDDWMASCKKDLPKIK